MVQLIKLLFIEAMGIVFISTIGYFFFKNTIAMIIFDIVGIGFMTFLVLKFASKIGGSQDSS